MSGRSDDNLRLVPNAEVCMSNCLLLDFSTLGQICRHLNILSLPPLDS